MSFTANRRPKCDGWCDDASAPVTHVDEKGFIYCAACGPRRRLSGHRCRKMTAAELRHVRAGEVIPHGYYGPSKGRTNPGPWQPKTGQKCSCKPGVHRDNCPACEGTGWRIDFHAIHDRRRRDEADRNRDADTRRNPTKVAREGRAAWGFRVCSRCQGYGWDRMNRPCKPCGGSGQVHKGVMKHGRRPNPSHPDCPGVSAKHRHYQGKCATDWNWGVGATSAVAIKTWPKHSVVAMVRPAYVAGLWDWEVKVHGKVVAEGNAKSSNHAKKWCVNTVGRLFGRSRSNPSIGLRGMPHTWVTKNGTYVSEGDTVEFWHNSGGRGDRPTKHTAKVARMLIFDDHVQVKHGTFGTTVDDTNFIRVVRKASRSNPILSVISNPLLSIASNPARRRRRKRR